MRLLEDQINKKPCTFPNFFQLQWPVFDNRGFSNFYFLPRVCVSQMEMGTKRRDFSILRSNEDNLFGRAQSLIACGLCPIHSIFCRVHGPSPFTRSVFERMEQAHRVNAPSKKWIRIYFYGYPYTVDEPLPIRGDVLRISSAPSFGHIDICIALALPYSCIR